MSLSHNISEEGEENNGDAEHYETSMFISLSRHGQRRSWQFKNGNHKSAQKHIFIYAVLEVLDTFLATKGIVNHGKTHLNTRRVKKKCVSRLQQNTTPEIRASVRRNTL